MPKFLVQNSTGKSVSLAIEPWADVEGLAPGGRVEFEYEEPAELSFSLDDSGGATASVLTNRLKVVGSGGEKAFVSPKRDWWF